VLCLWAQRGARVSKEVDPSPVPVFSPYSRESPHLPLYCVPPWMTPR
jgi:hypothetical protein